jgi:hypothetical protein
MQSPGNAQGWEVRHPLTNFIIKASCFMTCASIVGQKTQQWHGCGGTPARARGILFSEHQPNTIRLIMIIANHVCHAFSDANFFVGRDCCFDIINLITDYKLWSALGRAVIIS